MTSCSHCRRRKAKRQCPALGSALCPLCCGRLRQKELHCPPGCSFLSPHKTYQENKIIQKKGTISEEVRQDERMKWLMVNIEAPLREYAERDPRFADRDAVLALEYAKERIARSRVRFLLSREEAQVRNEAGEAVLASLEQCRFRRPIILLQDMERYTGDEKLNCLEHVILGIKSLSRGGLDGRTYIQNLSRRLDRAKETADKKKIITRV